MFSLVKCGAGHAFTYCQTFCLSVSSFIQPPPFFPFLTFPVLLPRPPSPRPHASPPPPHLFVLKILFKPKLTCDVNSELGFYLWFSDCLCLSVRVCLSLCVCLSVSVSVCLSVSLSLSDRRRDRTVAFRLLSSRPKSFLFLSLERAQIRQTIGQFLSCQLSQSHLRNT